MGEKCKTYVEIGTLWGGSYAVQLNLDDKNETEYIGMII